MQPVNSREVFLDTLQAFIVNDRCVCVCVCIHVCVVCVRARVCVYACVLCVCVCVCVCTCIIVTGCVLIARGTNQVY